MKPAKLKRNKAGTLDITWNDGKECSIPLQLFRDRCPCAMCSGETLFLGKHFEAPQQPHLPGRYELTELHPVGTYAIGAAWADGHNTGIYTWEYLMKLCEAPNFSQ